jgi:membrane-bound metal-dependent hydrolase YbcI (DUF457 family)
MAQAGLHALLGQAVSKWWPKKEWLMTGLFFGSIFPDFDNLAVALALVAKLPDAGLHRTFTHSILFIGVSYFLFWLLARIWKRPTLANFGLGFVSGLCLHILLDLLLWFNGVALAWPFPLWVNLWQGISPPLWLAKLLNPLEFILMAGFFWLLGQQARRHGTDAAVLPTLNSCLYVMLGLSVLFTPLAFWMEKGFMTLFGAVYLVMMGIATWLIFRMHATIEHG